MSGGSRSLATTFLPFPLGPGVGKRQLKLHPDSVASVELEVLVNYRHKGIIMGIISALYLCEPGTNVYEYIPIYSSMLT